jgi:hypothetical protein
LAARTRRREAMDKLNKAIGATGGSVNPGHSGKQR